MLIGGNNNNDPKRYCGKENTENQGLSCPVPQISEVTPITDFGKVVIFSLSSQYEIQSVFTVVTNLSKKLFQQTKFTVYTRDLT